MKTTKTTKKYITVDLTNVKNPADVYVAFVVAKCGVEPATKEELVNYALYATDAAMSTAHGVCKGIIDSMIGIIDMLVEDDDDAELEAAIKPKDEPEVEEKVEKKPNIFKRFWNWITRKK